MNNYVKAISLNVSAKDKISIKYIIIIAISILALIYSIIKFNV